MPAGMTQSPGARKLIVIKGWLLCLD